MHYLWTQCLDKELGNSGEKDLLFLVQYFKQFTWVMAMDINAFKFLL